VISVVVPACNAAGTLDGCLQALLDQTVPRQGYEVIVVDDGSLDATADVASCYAAEGVRLVRQPHQGLACARNAGVAQATGAIVLFTDPDCEPRPDWIEQLVAAFQDPEVVGARGTYLSRQRATVARFVQAEYEDRYDHVRREERIDFVDTTSAAYRRDVFVQNGGFDTSALYLADQEFSFRLAEKGYKLVFVPAAQVYHWHDRELLAYFERKFNIGVWKARVVQRHPERIVSDSHTPPVVRLQLVLLLLAMPLLLGSLVLALFGLPGWLFALGAAALAGLLFLLSSVPFILKTWTKDPQVALVTPAMLVVRAAALGMGYAIGSLRFLAYQPEERPVLSARHRLVKRVVDLWGAIAGLFIAAPLFVIIAVAVKLDSPGPLLYVQERVGANGRSFRMLKFRTMRQDAEQVLEQLLDLSHLDEPVFKLSNDPRVTRVGRVLRRFSLDELPQFLNVLHGEMSLVGPRPEEVRLVRLYNDHQRRRLAVKPGMTGPMQVSGRGNLTLAQRLELELDYIEHYSLLRDVDILFKTLPAVVRGAGAY
jgi:lipopolysaccharide/colanic/teichoic acid biosynthesis glycosyltransferase/GT2 family glycosyltransferase